MKSITIHNLDNKLDSLIREKSKKQGTSLNKTIQQLLKKSLGMKQEKNEDEFTDLFGIWTKEDEKDFKKNTKDLNKINPRDWE